MLRMTLGILLLLIAVTILASIILISKWVMEREGVDLDDQRLHWNTFEKLPQRQKFLLLLLTVPTGIFVTASLLYFLLLVILNATGGSV